MRELQEVWAAEQAASLPPLLHAMIYAVEYMKHRSGKEGRPDPCSHPIATRRYWRTRLLKNSLEGDMGSTVHIVYSQGIVKVGPNSNR